MREGLCVSGFTRKTTRIHFQHPTARHCFSMRDLPNIRHVVLMRSLIGLMSVYRLQMQLMSVFTFALLAPLEQCENWQTCIQRQRDEISTNQKQDSHKTYVYCLVNLGT